MSSEKPEGRSIVSRPPSRSRRLAAACRPPAAKALSKILDVQRSPPATLATPPARGPNYESQREMILEGAAELFAQRGFHGTSMNEVADACGLSKATLYHYYRDKSELLVSIADGHVSRLVELCDSVRGDASVRPVERLSVLIERFLVEYSHAQNSHRVLTEDVRFLEDVDRNKILDKERHRPRPDLCGRHRSDTPGREEVGLAKTSGNAVVRHAELDVYLAQARRASQSRRDRTQSFGAFSFRSSWP